MKDRPLIRVACGVLAGADGRVLLAQRPAGKIAAGRWEFPGGKIEPGETARAALSRELREELGIELRTAEPLIRFRHDYSDRVVDLDTWRVDAWDGTPHSRERQALAWRAPTALAGLDLLPTVVPIARVLRLSPHYVFTPPTASVDTVLAGLPALPSKALLRLRWPGLSESDYLAAARPVIPAAQGLGLRVLLDRAPEQVAALGADGWHADGRALSVHRQRPLPAGIWMAASVHDARQLAQAQALGADLAVLGPVRPTPTHPQAIALGWPAWQRLRADLPLSVYALGGVGPDQLATARSHGAQGVAGISAYWPR